MTDASHPVSTVGPGGAAPRPATGAVVIAPSAGRLAHRVARSLLDADRDVTLVHPWVPDVRDLVDRGAHLICGHAEARNVQRAALQRASALVWIPRTRALVNAPELSLEAARTAAWACAHARVPKVAVLSVVGDTDRLAKTPLAIVRDIEDQFTRGNSDTSIVRAGLFMDHLLPLARAAADRGVLRLPLPPDRPLPWVAIADVAEALIERIHGPSEPVEVLALWRPRTLSALALTEILGRVWQRPLRYEELSVEQSIEQLESAGLHPLEARWLTALWSIAASGAMDHPAPESSQVTVSTSLDEWASTVMPR